MSTRSRIGLLSPDGSVMSVYCHWDGYPSGVGQCLLENYRTVKDVVSLMRNGDIQSLGEDEESTEFFDSDQDDDLPFQPRTDETLDLFLKSDIEDYGYLFVCSDEKTGYGSWFIACGWIEPPRKLILLSQELILASAKDPGDRWWA